MRRATVFGLKTALQTAMRPRTTLAEAGPRAAVPLSLSFILVLLHRGRPSDLPHARGSAASVSLPRPYAGQH